MKPTKTILTKKFEKFNEIFFDNSLPSIDIHVNNSKLHFGVFTETIVWSGRRIQSRHPLHITISKYYSMTEKMIDETLIHEMIHYYISYNNLRDTGTHGVIFKRMADKISNSSEYEITITGDSRNLVPSSSKGKTYYIMMFTYKGKRYFSRVSKSIADSKIEDLSERYGVSDISIRTTNNVKVDRLSERRTRLSLIDYDTLKTLKIRLYRYDN